MSDTEPEPCLFCGGVHMDEASRSFNETPQALFGVPMKVCPNLPYDWVAIGGIDADMVVVDVTDGQPG